MPEEYYSFGILIRQREGDVMPKDKYPVTPAIRLLRAENVTLSHHLYAYEENGGTTVAARELGIDEHSVIKTLVMENEVKKPLIVLMHGDLEVSTKELARTLGVKKVTPCDPLMAQRHTGYLVGGISPFGTRRLMPVYIEETIVCLPKVFINGGKRGYLIGIDPREVQRILKATPVRVGI